MKNYFLFIFIIFLGNKCFAQYNTKVKEINNYYKVGKDFINDKKYEPAFKNFNLGLKESEKIKDKNLIAFGYFYLGR